MSLTTKYAAVVAKAQSLGVTDLQLKEVDGKLQLSGTTEYLMQKDMLWDAIKKESGWEQDIQADIRAQKTDIWGIWEVQSGDSLSKIAKSAYDDPKQYMRIFEANRNLLKDPNMIHPGQKLVIPRM